jgi:hypothetical protein
MRPTKNESKIVMPESDKVYKLNITANIKTLNLGP